MKRNSVLLGGVAIILLCFIVNCARRSVPGAEGPGRSSEDHYDLGKQCVAEGNYQQALQRFQQALALNPDFVPAYEALGLVQLKQGDIKEAQRSFQDGLEKDPRYAPLYIGLGRTYSAQKDEQQAIKHFQKALELDHSNADAFYFQGLSYVNMGLYSQAEESFKKALDNDPSYTPADQAWAALARMRMPPGQLPPEYAAIAKKPIINRSDFAALLAHHLPLADLCGSEEQTPSISDIEDSWARDEIRQVVSCGLMDILSADEFKPRERVTRLQCAIVVTEVLLRIPTGRKLREALEVHTSPFPDVSMDQEGFEAIMLATGSGIMKTRSDGFFDPEGEINGYLATRIVRGLRDQL